MAFSQAAAWRSPDLGERRMVETPAGPMAVHERGAGRPLVFVHGWLANANLWRGVTAKLAQRFRTVALDLPLGSHLTAMAPGADLSPAGVADLILAALEQLDLRDAVLVGNDSGGAYSRIALAKDASRVAALVLNASETPGVSWPPAVFAPLQAGARAGHLRASLKSLRDPALRMLDGAYGLVVGKPLDRAAGDSYVLPALEDDGVLADVQAAIALATTEAIDAASAQVVASFERPVALIWPADDQVFPEGLARAYAAALKDGRFETIADARSFTPEDQPEALADRIAAFADSLPPART
ncbi:pimeloyl-ACP methyl ester carboxylesterase [Caulobacter ginsengisoli]|uniref:Pimeloyl-ACP methyl ester carboxylesterase n=1 Tax=Caulobacter ginsengisoli TaxID=400775 RepID=A0ABU0ITY0_9CAUL|nr:alpha/beta fold hydrolase [Caulobacter ginsengisoli]MDQ0465459.1 pimeloyl-ACP methyl ester carboxylesterase [Caulobacter ginsengisoli]